MEPWMIALIAVAGLILILAIVFFAVTHVYSNYVIGSNYKAPEESDPSKYGVDTSWFDADEIKAALGEEKITSFDGLKLVSWTLKHKADSPVKKVAIVQHGYHAGPRSVQPFAKMFFEKGFDVYMPAARGHNISEGKYVGMAWLDRFDIMRWIDKVIAHYGSDVKIALFGISMGGSAVAAVGGMQPPPQVKCIIDDCGFSSQLDQYNAILKDVKIPKSWLMTPFSLGVRFKCGYSVSEADICSLVNNSMLPTLFIHGERDSFVPVELGKKLYEACGAEDKRLELFDAGHAASVAADRDRYTALLNEFVDKYIADEEDATAQENS